MLFNPDVSRLIRRPRIERPDEEFILPAPAEDPETGLLPPPDPATFEEELPLGQALIQEAAELQDLIDLITETADEIEVSIPDEVQLSIGSSRTTTAEYLSTLGSADPSAIQRRQQFEFGLLRGCGNSGTSWAVLTLGDLFDMREILTEAAQTVAGELIPLAPVKGSSWTQDLEESHVRELYSELIAQSKEYRLRFGSTVFTAQANLNGEVLESLLELLFDTQTEKLRSLLEELVQALRTLRAILCHTQFLLIQEYIEVRDALTSLIRTAILRRCLDAFGVVLSRVQQKLIEPILDLMDNGLGKGSLLDKVGDRVSQELIEVVGMTCGSLISRYEALGADLLRAAEAQDRLRLDKLQVLGERSTVGRWITHLDQVILLLSRLVNNSRLSRELALRAVDQIRQSPAIRSRLLDRLSSIPSR